MENNNAMTELEEIKTVDEVVESPEASSNGAFVAGVLGGLLAYAFVCGTKKLATFVGTKLEERKCRKAAQNIIDGEIVEEDQQEDSNE